MIKSNIIKKLLKVSQMVSLRMKVLLENKIFWLIKGEYPMKERMMA